MPKDLDALKDAGPIEPLPKPTPEERKKAAKKPDESLVEVVMPKAAFGSEEAGTEVSRFGCMLMVTEEGHLRGKIPAYAAEAIVDARRGMIYAEDFNPELYKPPKVRKR